MVPEISTAGDRFFFNFQQFFLPIYPQQPKKPKFQQKKIKKTPGDIIILQKYTKKHDHMLYCS